MLYRELITKGNEVYPFIIDYGQKNIGRESRALHACTARVPINYSGKMHAIKYLTLSNAKELFRSGITSEDLPIPNHNGKFTPIEDHGNYAFYRLRMSLFVTLATTFAENRNANAVVLGCDQDTTFLLEDLSNIVEQSTMSYVKLKAPFSKMSKAEIIKMGSLINVPLDFTFGCLQDTRYQCGDCDGCFLRRKGFKESGVNDETIYIDDPRAKKCCGG
jgi:7-cyano-7-deazaguanine synthase